MSDEDSADGGRRTRRQPPPFRRVAVAGKAWLTPRMQRVVLAGPELAGFELVAPAASVRLLLPPVGERAIAMPTWTGNQFELPNGTRAPIRTFTPRAFDRDRLALTIDIVVHERGAASDWVRSAALGDVVAISGPGRGYEIEPNASYLLVGDETALPAISQLLEAVPGSSAVEVHVELADGSAQPELPVHPLATVNWHELASEDNPGDAMVVAVAGVAQLPDAVWVAGEAAAVQRIRKHLFDVRGTPRERVTARGYWKHGRSAT